MNCDELMEFGCFVTALAIKKRKPPSLESLCLGFIGRHFEDIVEDLTEIAANFPSTMKVEHSYAWFYTLFGCSCSRDVTFG